MKQEIALVVISLMAASVANAAAPTLKVESGYKVHLRNIEFHENDRGPAVTGWASRAAGTYGPIAAHLHVDLIGTGSEVLRRVEYGLSGRLPIRPNRSEWVRVPLSEEQMIGVETISVKVAAGRKHD